MQVHHLPAQVWNDPRLSWNSSEHSNITEIQLPAKVLWTPDVVVFNRYGKAYVINLHLQ
jgi:hypothetical protein